MALSKPIPVFHKEQINILAFSHEFGDLSALDAFRGPKTPSNCQSLRHMLFFVSQGKSLDEAAAIVGSNVIVKHPTVPAAKLKAARYIKENVIDLYREARSLLNILLIL